MHGVFPSLPPGSPRPVLLAFCVLALAACSDDSPQCRYGAECASGACGADGRCLPATDAGRDAALDPDAADGDAGGDASAPDDDGGAPVCSPNHDGTVTRAEVPLAAGLHATFQIASDVPVDTAGTDEGEGRRRWDLAGALAGDHATLVELQPLAGTWFEGSFPGASYAAKLSDGADEIGVFEITDDALLLRGVVSPEGGLTRTELTYDPPVTVLSFPLTPGAHWSTESTVTGVTFGAVTLATERYESSIDRSGTLATPYGEFPVQRVSVLLTRTLGFLVTTLRTHLFVAECFGTVASIVSQDNEPAVDFTDAAEVRRLAP